MRSRAAEIGEGLALLVVAVIIAHFVRKYWG